MRPGASSPCGGSARAPAFSRVVIMADLLRPFPVGGTMESATWKNTRWLFHLLAPGLRDCGLEPRALAWDDRAAPQTGDWFDTPALFHALGLPLTLESWASLCSQGTAPQALVDALAPCVGDALVIGYELPPPIVDALARLGRPFLDVILHPVRFMPDLVFALRTNVPAYHAYLRAHRIADGQFRAQAALILAKAAWMPRPMPMPPGTALVLGQVGTDRAVVAPDGSFASLERHLPFLHELCCRHPLVLFRPHPYASDDDPSVRAIGRLPAIRTTGHNFYHLLAQPEVTTVVALNSSGLTEARYFDREAIHLMPPLYDFTTDTAPAGHRPGAPVPLPGVWTSPDFWRGMLAATQASPLAPAALSLPPVGILRRSMNADWGYGFIERTCA